MDQWKSLINVRIFHNKSIPNDIEIFQIDYDDKNLTILLPMK